MKSVFYRLCLLFCDLLVSADDGISFSEFSLSAIDPSLSIACHQRYQPPSPRLSAWATTLLQDLLAVTPVVALSYHTVNSVDSDDLTALRYIQREPCF